MLRVYHLIIGLIFIIVLTPLGAKFVVTHLLTSKSSQSHPAVTGTKNSISSNTPNQQNHVKSVNIWQKLLNSNSAPNNWEVIPCEQDAALLCVNSQGKRLGTVELLVYPVVNNPEFQKHLTEVGLTVGSKIDYKNHQSETKLIKALQAWVADSYNRFAKDNQGKQGNQIALSTYPPQQVTMGKLQGIRYGFVGLKPDGSVEEQHIGYVTYDGTKLYVIGTSFNSGSSQAKFDKLENLAIFQSYLSAIAENLNLP